jgi:hypothetical protein
MQLRPTQPASADLLSATSVVVKTIETSVVESVEPSVVESPVVERYDSKWADSCYPEAIDSVSPTNIELAELIHPLRNEVESTDTGGHRRSESAAYKPDVTERVLFKYVAVTILNSTHAEGIESAVAIEVCTSAEIRERNVRIHG